MNKKFPLLFLVLTATILASIGCREPGVGGLERSLDSQDDGLSTEPLASAGVITDKPVLLLNFLSALCVTQKGNGELKQELCKNEREQRFWLNQVRDGKFQIVSLGKGCVELAGTPKEAAANGAHYAMKECADTPAQYFRLQPDASDYRYSSLVSALSGKCVDVIGQSVDGGTALHQWTCGDNMLSQKFLAEAPAAERVPFPHVVWMYWNSGEDQMPNFHKANLKVMRDRLGPNWKVIVLDNLPASANYVGKHFDLNLIPSEAYLASKIGADEANGKLKNYIVYSDFVRLAALQTHGGFYADASTILHRDLQEIVDVLETFPHFAIGGYTSPHQATRGLRYADSIENFFLYARPQTKFLKAWLDNFRDYWLQKQPLVDIHDHPMYNGENGLLDNFDKTYGGLRNYLNQHLAFRYTLLKNPEFIDDVFIRGLRARQENGPFTLLDIVGYNGDNLLTMTPNDIDDAVKILQGSNISKFASENTVSFKDKPLDFFFDASNIFGRLNAVPTPGSLIIPTAPTATVATTTIPSRSPLLIATPVVAPPAAATPGTCVDVLGPDVITKKPAQNQKVPKLIWTFWDTGEKNLPAFQALNVNNWRRKLAADGYRVIVVNTVVGDKDNIWKLLGYQSTLLPDFFNDLDKKVQTYHSPDGGLVKAVPAIVQSDFIRLALLEKFGGVWMDASNVLTGNIEKLIPSGFIASDATVAGYVMDSYASASSPRINNHPVDGLENWLIVAKPHSPLIATWLKAFTEYWRTRTPTMQIHTHPMYDCNFDFGGLGISAANYLNEHAALKYVLKNRPSLNAELYPLDINPWWFHGKAKGTGDQAQQILQTSTGPDHKALAIQVLNEGVAMLKFAGPHLAAVNQAFKTRDDFCNVPNFFAELSGSICRQAKTN